jgi:branched-chain amino acid transport system permease protein
VTRWLRGSDAPIYVLVVVGTLLFVAYQKAICIDVCPIGFLAHTRAPDSILGIGVVEGALNALPALALVLVFRTNRIVNFAQGDLGGFAAVLAASLLVFMHWPYLPALLIAVLAAAVVAGLVELSVVRYFFSAPRLILTVAIIGVSQILAALQLLTPTFFPRGNVAQLYAFPQPFDFKFKLDPLHTFQAADLLAVVLSPLLAVGLFLLLRYTILGAAIRASSEDIQHARGLGIPAKRLSTLVWIMAGVVSALSSVLSADVNGFAFGVLVGPGFLMRSIAPAVIGRFENLGLTFVAAIGLGVVESGFLFQTAADGPVEFLLFLIVLAALLLRAPALGRQALRESSTWQLLREVRPIPAVLRRVPEVRALTTGVPALAVLGLLLIPVIARPDQLQGAQGVLEYAIVGISLVILSGWAGQISLGQWGIAGVGALTAAQLFSGAHLDFVASLALGGVVGAMTAALIGLPSLRIGGYFLAVATLAFAIAASTYLFFVKVDFQVLGHGIRFFDIPVSGITRPMLFGRFNGWVERNFYYFVLAVFLACFYIATQFRRSRLGRSLVALRDNEVAGSTLGLAPMRLKLIAFMVSGFMAGVAGGLFAFTNTVVTAQVSRGNTFAAETSLILFAIVVFGGLGSPAGAVLGAVIVYGINLVGLGDYAFLASGFGILLMLFIAPGGIGEVVYDVRDLLLRQVARRRGLQVAALEGPEPEPEELVATGAPLADPAT